MPTIQCSTERPGMAGTERVGCKQACQLSSTCTGLPFLCSSEELGEALCYRLTVFKRADSVGESA